MSRVAAQLRDVIDAAHRRVASCECGRETSCYRCLRGFRNQWRHDELRRGPVADLLEALLGDSSGREPAQWAPIGGEALTQLDGRRVRGIHRGHDVEGTLWVESDGDRVLTLLLEEDSGFREGPPDAFQLTHVTR